MSPAQFNILNNELLKKYPDVVPEQSSLIILYIKSAICMANNVKDTKHTRNISRRMNLKKNGEEWNLNKTVWCEGGLQLEGIGVEPSTGYLIPCRIPEVDTRKTTIYDQKMSYGQTVKLP